MVRPQYNFDNLVDFINFLYTAKGYLEKANGSNLGDFTDAGKIVNAGYNNYTVYWQWYNELGYGNLQGEPYCAGAVSTMMVSAFGLSKAKSLLCGNLYQYCPTGYDQFNNKGRIYSKPKVCDIVFFWSDKLGRYSHTGIVIGVDSNGTGYTTWEANTSSGNDTVVRNGGATCIKHYSSIGKTRFGRPDWAGNGIAETKPKAKTYNIGCGANGLKCTAPVSLNVRKYAGKNATIIGSIAANDMVKCTKKCFVDGDPWFYVPDKSGWCSAKYFTGWIQELDDGGKWWYLDPGYEYPVNQIRTIGSVEYFFGADGYMFVGTMILQTDESGALKIDVK